MLWTVKRTVWKGRPVQYVRALSFMFIAIVLFTMPYQNQVNLHGGQFKLGSSVVKEAVNGMRVLCDLSHKR